jgi:hypothetical protein
MVLKLLRSLAGHPEEKDNPADKAEEVFRPMALGVAIGQIGDAGALIEVAHRACTVRLPQTQPFLDLFEREEGFTTVSLISVTGPATTLRIRYYWQPIDEQATHLCLHFIEPTQTLFIGVGNFFAILKTDSWEVLAEYRPQPFWSFESMHGCILARSELECFLFSPTGELLQSVPVDPPWDEEIGSEGIEFESPVNGRQFLAWPA